MVAVGDKVVYPMHGAGIVEALEEHEVLGKKQYYYVLTMFYGGMRVMIPQDQVGQSGLRAVVGETEIAQVKEVLSASPEQDTGNWNRRINNSLTKIKSGSILEVAEVVRNLMKQEVTRRLSTGERRLLDTAKQILISELVLACDKDVDSVEGWVTDWCKKIAPNR
ncbi:transcriptional regulator, CarD family [Thermosinus carboxydivorans Nor1]|uniref:Transcriptional regulator, CarD family n=1 Tax=Thermosinus carboxydivorans Nor1 TaxID=401526 RepID=A1HTI6_9FIRM|nr:CarD family transcriptional regulator [Thermosinus carboxydivorans]EAX46663.1 transcriptional regulator, CarD family [Thermosinus carboxydivorans Nor1]